MHANVCNLPKCFKNFKSHNLCNSYELAVIVSKCKGKRVLCKHRERNTYEFRGGHREEGEDILTTAELYEETGAIDYIIKPICIYSVCGNNGVTENKVTTFDMLYYADINKFE